MCLYLHIFTLLINLFIYSLYELKVFEDRALRRIFGPKKKEVRLPWRHMNEELHNLYTIPNIICTIKSRWMNLAGNAVGHGESAKRMQQFSLQT